MAGGYEIDMEKIPQVHFSEHKDWETLYQTAWDSHKSNITAITKELNGELTTDEKQSYYVDAVNPPMFAWAEWEQYKIHGDVERFTKVIKGKTILERLASYYQFIKRTRTYTSGPAEGLQDSGMIGEIIKIYEIK